MTLSEFDNVIEFVISFLEQDCIINPESYRKSGEDFEPCVKRAVDFALEELGLPDEVDYTPGGHGFPDIVIVGADGNKYGIEVKSSSSAGRSWRINGNSILGSTRVPGIRKNMIVFGKVRGADSLFRAKEYEKCISNVVVTHSPRYEVQNALSIGTDSEGGYLVPDEYERTLVEALNDEVFFRNLATVIKTSSGDRKIPIVTSKGEAAWIDEGGQFTESNDSFGQTTIGAHKLATMIKVSDELLNDSVFNIEQYISREFGRRIGAKEEEAFFIGDGAGKPTGIFNATGGAETGVTAANTTITFDDVMDLYYSLRAPYRNKAVWLLNDSTVKAIRKLKDGNGNYIWQPSVREGEPDRILNRPYRTSIYVPELAAGKRVMAFGDYSYYWIAERQGRSFKRLNELYATTGQVGFLASERVDGKLILSEAVKTLDVKAAGK